MKPADIKSPPCVAATFFSLLFSFPSTLTHKGRSANTKTLHARLPRFVGPSGQSFYCRDETSVFKEVYKHRMNQCHIKYFIVDAPVFVFFSPAYHYQANAAGPKAPVSRKALPTETDQTASGLKESSGLCSECFCSPAINENSQGSRIVEPGISLDSVCAVKRVRTDSGPTIGVRTTASHENCF